MSTPSANIQLVIGEVDEATAAMRNSNDSVLTPAVVTAKKKVDETLGTDLNLPATVAVLQPKFEQFIGQLQELVDTVGKYAVQFDEIKNGLVKMDEEYAKAITNPQ